MPVPSLFPQFMDPRESSGVISLSRGRLIMALSQTPVLVASLTQSPVLTMQLRQVPTLTMQLRSV